MKREISSPQALRRWHIVLSAMLALLMVASSALLAAPSRAQVVLGSNLVKNGSFETDNDNNGKPDIWSGNGTVAASSYQRSNAVKYNGTYSLRHRSTAEATYIVSQVVSGLTAGSLYRVSGWTNIPATADSFSYTIELVWRNASGTNISVQTVKRFTAQTTGWVWGGGDFLAPAGTTNAVVRMNVVGLSATIYADAFNLKLNTQPTSTSTTGPTETATGTTPTNTATRTTTPTRSATITITPTHTTPTATTVTPTVPTGPDTGDDWLHVVGNDIVDSAGRPVWLTGANWFGYNATERVFHGLWAVNIDSITRQLGERGLNMIRVPISTQLILEWKAGDFSHTPNVNTHVNPELVGKNSLQIFDHWLTLCKKYGLKVMLDVHSAEADNSGHIYPVWYKGTITSEQFYQAWEWITARYKNDDTILAMDIKNEPHGARNETLYAKWDDSTDVNNWKHACETAGRRILAINPNVLILCEGNQIYPKEGQTWSSPPTQADGRTSNYYNTWWGGNLRGVKDHPINLGANQDQLVYSPHDYGPSVYQQPWFEGTFTMESLTNDVWRPNWFFIHEQNIAPLLMGEWGGHMDGGKNQQWMTMLRDFMIAHKIHHTFWCVNPNSGDTGGLLGYDWVTWDAAKYGLLKPSLWQTSGGKFVGLDHKYPLGSAAVGVTVTEYYQGGNPPPWGN